ncbi:SMR family transporter [Denitratisoma oestradiolicum]|uniref:Small multidrug resistance protein n=1 Tax=Denitratisoma oestradiolicum TaxID=311182 RepID=A0A6S6YN92_9PROT|nr:SMR family transporter [Denitratisoma oestradiolicum]TWO82273.1 4-amino-4-deoxy-L-arabinose transferase [Denitratisoma oestradiolicum]CAB1369226.1 Small multidrug resistance protein [Denitratisoma oestradiolicum]
MTPIAFTLILTGVLLNAAAQLLLKAGTNVVGHFDFHLDNLIPIGMKIAFQPYIMGGMVCYAVSLVVWIMALSRVPVSIAYPMLSIGYVINALVAHYWFGEALVMQKMLGIGFIIIGVVLVAKS